MFLGLHAISMDDTVFHQPWLSASRRRWYITRAADTTFTLCRPMAVDAAQYVTSAEV